jgi:adenosylcobalamin-dependent ribonucleoside-triphosphate reductase
VAHRVALGNVGLLPDHLRDSGWEGAELRDHIAAGRLLMSGRHLQHGDGQQHTRNMEVFTNCATAATSFLKFYLLLNGSGVGRSYDDDMMLVDWDRAPTVRCVLDESHPDFDHVNHESRRDAQHKYGHGHGVIWHEVGDSREGWAKAVEILETMAFERCNTDKLLVLDFSPVRCKGSPIGGMQDRPASGPAPLMAAFAKVMTVRGAGMSRWLQAMYVDHYFAECVLVGGARRASRIAVKWWEDPSIFDFIQVKRPIEFVGKTVEEVQALRSTRRFSPFLWSSNNSVLVDGEFWRQVNLPREGEPNHAQQVFDLVMACAYGDGTGEPALINAHKIAQNDAGWSDLNRGDWAGSPKYQVEDEAQILLSKLAKRAKRKKHHTIVNPCGEIPLNVLGGYCVIADNVPFHADTIEEIEDALRAAVRALMRTNLMPSVYAKEVTRTNRIGVGFTAIHEFAWKFFGFGFRDLIDETKSADFWSTMDGFNEVVRQESVRYAAVLGVAVPHTCTTIKPAGTTSKLFHLTEGWHLPSHREFLRWVQFRYDDPLIEVYRAAGYPSRELRTYQGTVIIGFPTAPAITELGMGDKLVTADEATPDEQFQWLKLGERHWIEGKDPHAPLYGGQISYTMKLDQSKVSFEQFKELMLKHMPDIRCCAVMFKEDTSAYEYLPEEPISHERFVELVTSIEAQKEDVGREHVGCDNGACPVDFGEKA